MSNMVQRSDHIGGESMGDKNMKKKQTPDKKAPAKAAEELPKAAAKPKKK